VGSIELDVNGKKQTVDVDPDTPLLWVLREGLGLTGTKYSCGIGVCGSCIVLLGDDPIRSCSTTVSEAAAHRITTIEGLSLDRSHPVQRAWIEEDVPQCGYCQSGQILAATGLLMKNPDPSDADIDTEMAGILCRCGTYVRIRRAIHRAAKAMKHAPHR
jgi:aerobic-type carbon monoxide dehydrogenase small subunit (CoxS/CutS family)